MVKQTKRAHGARGGNWPPRLLRRVASERKERRWETRKFATTDRRDTRDYFLARLSQSFRPVKHSGLHARSLQVA